MTGPQLTARFGEALAYAHDAHIRQQRKGSTTPYVAHLLAVSGLVLEHGGDEDEAIAAVLHDAIEDQGGAGREADIRARFGDRVAAIVRDCSAEEKDGSDWRTRKQRYIDHVAGAPRSAVLVSLADKLHNSRSILADHRRFGDGVWERFSAGRDEQRWYYRALRDGYQTAVGDDAALRPLLDELDRTITAIWPD